MDLPEPEPSAEFRPYDFKSLAAGDDTYESEAAQDLLDIARKLADRQREGLKLFEPLPLQAEFHASDIRIRLLRGSNRGGKTLPAAVELARAVTNQDPHGKYPARDGIAFVVGKDWDHIGQIIYRKLFEPGAFKIILDEETGMWRSFRPWSESDVKRKKQSRNAPPIIPKRLIKSIAWRNKKKREVTRCELATGWVIRFFSGMASPPQGEAVNLIWLDEEIKDEAWFPEMTVRTGEERLRIMWSATPQNATIQFYDLCKRAEETRHLKFRTVDEFYIQLANNPHIDEQTKADMAAELSDEDRLVRIEGQFALGGMKIFGEWSLSVHGVPAFDVPREWTHFAVVDPGHQIGATLFAACPPPGYGKGTNRDGMEIVLYDELYIPGCTAAIWGEQFAAKCHGRQFEAFIIDTRGSRVTEIASGKTVIEQYAEELVRHNVRSNRTGYNFAWGCDDPVAGIERVRRYLAVQDGIGWPRLRVMVNTDGDGRWEKRLKQFQHEVERYLYRRDKDLVTDQPDEAGKRTHLMACLRYLVMHNPKYVVQGKRQQYLCPVYKSFLKHQQERMAGNGPRHTHFGPPRAKEYVA